MVHKILYYADEDPKPLDLIAISKEESDQVNDLIFKTLKSV